MSMPTFVVIGAAKSGTTALQFYLQQHPDVYLPLRQEPSWFSFADQRLAFTGPAGLTASVNRYAITERSAYEALYDDAEPASALGDVSPVYLYWPGTAERVAKEVPDARIVAILRNPVDRAYSAYMHARREDLEPIHDFIGALEAEPQRIAGNCGFIWRYRDLGRYAPQLSRWLEIFPQNQLFIETYEVFAANPEDVCRRVQEFIGVDDRFVPDTSLRHNVSGLPRSRALHRLLKSDSAPARLIRSLSPEQSVESLKRVQTRLRTALLERVPLDPQLRAELTNEWRSDIEEIADLVPMNIAHWLNANPASTS